ncbi:MAG: GNAT family N-acetyltransferase [Hyphomicrobiaceae bacterium]
MTATLGHDITFVRLPEIALNEILVHMSDPRVAEHMPLLTCDWDRAVVAEFIIAKEMYWQRDGLGHWAILSNGCYVGWGGFQREGDDWDFGLVLKPYAFGLGPRILKKAIAFAVYDRRIQTVTFLLPPSRKKLKAFERLGASLVGERFYEGAKFLKYSLQTD